MRQEKQQIIDQASSSYWAAFPLRVKEIVYETITRYSKNLHAPHVEGNTAVEILDVTADSRAVKAGSLFIALDGATVDGHNYVNKAVESGAVAVLVSKPVEVSSDVCVITVEDTRAAMMSCKSQHFLIIQPILCA